MRRIAFFLVVLLAFAAPMAGAQNADDWTDASGRFSMGFSALGWTELSPPADDPTIRLAIEHREFQQNGLMRTCFITERRQAGPTDGRLTQTNLNAVATTMGLAALERANGAVAMRGQVIMVDGVAVTDAVFDGPTRQYMRVFYVKDGPDFVQVLINCGANSPVEAEVDSNIVALLQTLRMHPD